MTFEKVVRVRTWRYFSHKPEKAHEKRTPQSLDSELEQHRLAGGRASQALSLCAVEQGIKL